MYTSTPANVPDPPFQFFEGLVPRLGPHKPNYCKIQIVDIKMGTNTDPSTTADECTCHATLVGRMLSVGTIHFEDRSCASKKGGIGRGGRVSPQGGAVAGGLLENETQCIMA